jgi:hypothetical protein
MPVVACLRCYQIGAVRENAHMVAVIFDYLYLKPYIYIINFGRMMLIGHPGTKLLARDGDQLICLWDCDDVHRKSV